MRASCRFAMAVHVLAVLAHKKGCVSSTLLAQSVNTHPVIIRRLLLTLQAAKLVQTRKGAGSGSSLGRPAGKITLAEVYRAVEGGQPFAMPRRSPNGECPIGHAIQGSLVRVFMSAQMALERDLKRMTLAGVLAEIRNNDTTG